MSTKIGSLIQAIGERLAVDFPDYEIIYGLPTANGFRDQPAGTIRVHHMQERGTFAASQLAGPIRVSPTIAVTLARAYAEDSSALAPRQDALDVLADLRLSVTDLVYDQATNQTTIPAFTGQALWLTDYTATPAPLDIGVGQSVECMTIDFTFQFSTTYGGR